MRFIVRPNSIGKTPRRLRSALEARRAIKVSEVVQSDYLQDIYLAYPNPRLIANAPEGINEVYSFYQTDKYKQRIALASYGLPVVPTVTIDGFGNAEQYVVRPLRHRAGLDYRLTPSPTDYDPATQYISNLIPKKREYRALFYKGQHVCTYIKQNPEMIDPSLPWTHASGARFATINTVEMDKVAASGLLSLLADTTLTEIASLVAYDVLQSTGGTMWVCEANLCPGITITGTIDKIVQIEERLTTC